jgi:hypothetical protein
VYSGFFAIFKVSDPGGRLLNLRTYLHEIDLVHGVEKPGPFEGGILNNEGKKEKEKSLLLFLI